MWESPRYTVEAVGMHVGRRLGVLAGWGMLGKQYTDDWIHSRAKSARGRPEVPEYMLVSLLICRPSLASSSHPQPLGIPEAHHPHWADSCRAGRRVGGGIANEAWQRDYARGANCAVPRCQGCVSQSHSPPTHGSLG